MQSTQLVANVCTIHFQPNKPRVASLYSLFTACLDQPWIEPPASRLVIATHTVSQYFYCLTILVSLYCHCLTHTVSLPTVIVLLSLSHITLTVSHHSHCLTSLSLSHSYCLTALPLSHPYGLHTKSPPHLILPQLLFELFVLRLPIVQRSRHQLSRCPVHCVVDPCHTELVG